MYSKLYIFARIRCNIVL